MVPYENWDIAFSTRRRMELDNRMLRFRYFWIACRPARHFRLLQSRTRLYLDFEKTFPWLRHRGLSFCYRGVPVFFVHPKSGPDSVQGGGESVKSDRTYPCSYSLGPRRRYRRWKSTFLAALKKCLVPWRFSFQASVLYCHIAFVPGFIVSNGRYLHWNPRSNSTPADQYLR